jgi:hypothetical protein
MSNPLNAIGDDATPQQKRAAFWKAYQQQTATFTREDMSKDEKNKTDSDGNVVSHGTQGGNMAAQIASVEKGGSAQIGVHSAVEARSGRQASNGRADQTFQRSAKAQGAQIAQVKQLKGEF